MKLNPFYLLLTVHLIIGGSFLQGKESDDRIPYYEDYIENGNLDEYIRKANQFLDEKADAPEAPRLALDLLMMGKAAEEMSAVVRGTDLLLFDYLGSLPSLHFLSTFDPGSRRLSELLKAKANEGDLSSQKFSKSYADAISLLARLQGPQLLADSGLRLFAYLVTTHADYEKLHKSIRESVEQLVKNKDKLAPLAKIILSDEPPLDKARKLSKVSLPESKFCIKYYLAQISDEEQATPKFAEFLIELKLFSPSSDPDEAIKLIKSLDRELSQTAKILFWEAFALRMDGQEDASLEKISQLLNTYPKDNNDWSKTAESMANGMKFVESRKSLLLDQLNNVYQRLEEPQDSLVLKGTWNIERNDTLIPLQIHLAVSNSSSTFELQVIKNEKPFFFYRTDQNSSSLISPDGIFHNFAQGGPYPIPLLDISRDSSEGTFNYKFNLNFGREFEDSLKQVRSLLDNPYASTPKGRQVLLDYLVERKGLWISPPKSLENGTRFSLNTLQANSVNYSENLFEIDLSGNLTQWNIGGLNVHSIKRGESTIMKSIPSWPKGIPRKELDSFEMPILLKAIGELMAN